MSSSRRDLLQLGTVAAAMAVLPRSARAAAGPASPTAADRPAPPASAASAASPDDLVSREERELKVVNLALLEEEARKLISPKRFSFTGPAGDGVTYRENTRAFNDYPVMPRRLQGIGKNGIDIRTKLLGHDLALPILTCPMGNNGRFHVEAEAASARGAGAAGTIFTASQAANKTLEEIAAATPGPKWFQIYLNRDPEVNKFLVEKARAAGFSAVVFTADSLGAGNADDYVRLGSYKPPELTFANHDPAKGGRGKFNDFKWDVSFDDIKYLRDLSGLPVIVKGVTHPADVQKAVRAGASAIWVSNHGGRQIDGVPASISTLEPAAKAVAGKVPIIFDSGIRRGIDVLKALALGASVVAIGRPVLWGLINGGSLGVKSVYDFLGGELKNAMLLSGVDKLADIKRELVTRA